MIQEAGGSSPSECAGEVAQLRRATETREGTPEVGGASPSLPTKVHHYIVVRVDLPIGMICSYVAHAAGETGGPAAKDAHVVVLGAAGLADIEQISARLKAAGVEHVTIDEDGVPMSIGCFPIDRRARPAIAKALSSIPLVRAKP